MNMLERYAKQLSKLSVHFSRNTEETVHANDHVKNKRKQLSEHTFTKHVRSLPSILRGTFVTNIFIITIN